MKTIKIVASLVALLMSHYLYAAATTTTLENAANQIIIVLKQNKADLKNNPQIIIQAVEQYLLPEVDVTGMARSVLGRQTAMKLKPAQWAKFEHEFTRLVIRTYARPLAEYSNETIKFSSIKIAPNGRFALLKSVIIRPNSKNIPLNYSLVLKNGKWKIYDFTAEGVSLIQSFRSQFAQELQNADIEDVIKQMHAKQAA